MNESDQPRTSILPAVTLIAIALFSLAWLMMFAGAGFPISFVLALLCVASPFAIGILTWRLRRQRARSAAHRVAYYVCIAFFGILAASICTSQFPIADAATLVGTYLPDEATRADLDQRLHLLTPNHRIELRGDGTFSMTDVPDFWQLSETPTALISATGTWSPRGRSVAIEYTGATSIPPTDRSEYHYSAEIEVLGFFPPYRLRVTLGDPDSGYTTIFTKAR